MSKELETASQEDILNANQVFDKKGNISVSEDLPKRDRKTVIRKYLLKTLTFGSIQPVDIIKDIEIPYTAGFDVIKNKINTGLTYDEEAELLPLVLPVSASDPKFREEVKNYYKNFSEKVPVDGITIDGSYDEIDGKIQPHNIKEYLWVKMLLNDATVHQADSNQPIDEYICKFELVDLNKKKEQEEKAFTAKLKAEMEYVKILNGGEKAVGTMREIYILLADPTDVSVIEIDSLGYTPLGQRLKQELEKSPERFVKVATNPNIKVAALVTEAISLNIITRVGDSYYLDNQINLATDKNGVVRALLDNEDLLVKTRNLVKDVKDKYK